jgi:hypothetical protein
MTIFPKASPPNVFIGGPVRGSPGFPLKACGNDGLGKDISLTQQAAGIDPQRFKQAKSFPSPTKWERARVRVIESRAEENH